MDRLSSQIRNLERTARTAGLLLLCGLVLATFPGCSLFVMFGKMVKGDPLQSNRFKSMTKVDLVKSKKTILVLCSLPDHVNLEYSSIQNEMMDGITRRMKREKIKVISSDKVADWIDEQGGLPKNMADLARDFETDYIAWIDINQFSTTEENSSKLNRGRCSGYIRVYRVEEIGKDRGVQQIFNTEFRSVYPRHQPIADVNRSKDVFHKGFVDQVCEELGEMFYDHKNGMQF